MVENAVKCRLEQCRTIIVCVCKAVRLSLCGAALIKHKKKRPISL
jgi:hypothetical protein